MLPIEEMKGRLREIKQASARLDAIQRPKKDPRDRVVIQTHDAAICAGGRSMWRIIRAPSCTCHHNIIWFFFWRFRLGIRY